MDTEDKAKPLIPDEGATEPNEVPPIPDDYTAFQKWEYTRLICKTEYDKYLDMADSFCRGAIALVEGGVKGRLYEDIEGVAGVFLFRHYLELILKRIALRGRMLQSADQNAVAEDVKAIAPIHDLSVLWKWVLADAKPKLVDIDCWAVYDIAFVEQIVEEFDAVDKKGFAFRYPGHGGARCSFDFPTLLQAMDHVRQVLDGMLTCLIEKYGQNEEWEQMVRDEAGW